MQSQTQLRRAGTLLLIIGVLYIGVRFLKTKIAPPTTFPTPLHITIERGQSLFSISKELSESGAIRSRRIFEMLVITFGNQNNISEGEYYFEKPVSVVTVALRIAGRQFGTSRIKVTFPEGFSNNEMAQRLSESFPSFNKQLFLDLTKNREGYLFPDTYGFFPSTSPDAIVAALKKNFDTKTQKLKPAIASSGHSLAEIITMASIIEKEASGDADRGIVSGILWNRISAGIPLQVDAPFLYLLGKESKDLTKTDLAIESPFNTYTHKGLPPSPINNPGLASIEAALHPESTVYFYYLHDKNGTIHYAKTYAEHQKNIRLYLR